MDVFQVKEGSQMQENSRGEKKTFLNFEIFEKVNCDFTSPTEMTLLLAESGGPLGV